ncbi:MAG: hypothetical protein ACPGRX_00955 [Bdellovibrionales bacterium]
MSALGKTVNRAAAALVVAGLSATAANAQAVIEDPTGAMVNVDATAVGTGSTKIRDVSATGGNAQTGPVTSNTALKNDINVDGGFGGFTLNPPPLPAAPLTDSRCRGEVAGGFSALGLIQANHAESKDEGGVARDAKGAPVTFKAYNEAVEKMRAAKRQVEALEIEVQKHAERTPERSAMQTALDVQVAEMTKQAEYLDGIHKNTENDDFFILNDCLERDVHMLEVVHSLQEAARLNAHGYRMREIGAVFAGQVAVETARGKAEEGVIKVSGAIRMVEDSGACEAKGIVASDVLGIEGLDLCDKSGVSAQAPAYPAPTYPAPTYPAPTIVSVSESYTLAAQCVCLDPVTKSYHFFDTPEHAERAGYTSTCEMSEPK